MIESCNSYCSQSWQCSHTGARTHRFSLRLRTRHSGSSAKQQPGSGGQNSPPCTHSSYTPKCHDTCEDIQRCDHTCSQCDADYFRWQARWQAHQPCAKEGRKVRGGRSQQATWVH